VSAPFWHARMKRDPKGQMRQTAAEYAQEIRRWGRYSEEQIRKAVTYALDRGTVLPENAEAAGAREKLNKEGINSEEEKVCPWCGSPLDDPFACDHCEWGKGGEA